MLAAFISSLAHHHFVNHEEEGIWRLENYLSHVAILNRANRHDRLSSQANDRTSVILRSTRIFGESKSNLAMSKEEEMTHYQATLIEEKWYQHWENSGYFHSEPDERPAYSIVIPPPNVTGILHMGHMLNNTIQDVLIRHARMNGFNACWVPGTDHASIATEAKVVKWLREEKGLTKGDLGREKFLEYAWEWTEKYGGIILDQLRRLGASADWDRTAFTMDDVRSREVIKAFVDLYHSDKLYRDWRMVNWDPQAQTVLSNEEVIHNEENGGLYYVKYLLEDKSDHLVIATTRPETILADTALAVHPDDERYQKFIGKKVVVPICNRLIPVIADDYVDIEFGTGALKITPAHDPNDYEIGLKHELEIIDMFSDDGRVNDKVDFYVGEDRFDARISMKKALQSTEHLVRVEDYRHKVGRSERTNAVIEPKLSLQWYVKMKELANPALEAIQTTDVSFVPKNQENLYRHWMENIRDWCVSRQLWWGHRIPAYYYKNEVFVATSKMEAVALAVEKFSDETISDQDLMQDEDVLDTWFSSWLWPYSVFMDEDGKGDVDYYYPTTVLVTGWDIIFLWVARMMMAGYEWKQERPFRDVYFTGMVRDKQRRKMSKSLGNSPDALGLIDKFGADGVRFGMLSCSPAGGDLLFDEKLCDQGSKFCNKMWNALRLIKRFEITDQDLTTAETLAAQWMLHTIKKEIETIREQIAAYKLSEALIRIYSLIWGDYCSWYLEMIKPAQGESMSQQTREASINLYEELMRLLHPFMPFVTEEIWHQLRERAEGDDCMMSSYPTTGEVDNNLKNDVDHLKLTIATIRDLRNQNEIKERHPLKLQLEAGARTKELLQRPGYLELLKKLGHLEEVSLSNSSPENAISFIVKTEKYYLITGNLVNAEDEKLRLSEELEYIQGFVSKVLNKLSNERFVNNAPAAVVEKERKKLADGQARLRIIQESLSELNSHE